MEKVRVNLKAVGRQSESMGCGGREDETIGISGVNPERSQPSSIQRTSNTRMMNVPPICSSFDFAAGRTRAGPLGGSFVTFKGVWGEEHEHSS